MRVALIFPPFGHVEHLEKTRIEEQEFGVFPPLNLAYVASIIRHAGHDVALIDSNALKLDKEQTLKRLQEFNPDLLGFMLTTYMFQKTLDWIRYFKEKTGLPAIVGGINLRLYPAETMSHKEIDFAIMGPARRALPEFLSCFEEDGNYEHIKGLCYRKGTRVIINYPKETIENLEALPFPARDLLPNERYYSYISQRKNFTVITTSFGCPYQCVFCDEGNTRYRARTPRNVADEIEECVEKYGIREIDFFDREFTLDRRRVIGICDEMIRRKIKVEWTCRARVDSVDNQMLSRMKEAGCRMILYGIESGDERILRNLKKDITLDQVRKTVRLTKKNKIRVLGFFMIGNPGDTEETVKKTIRFAKELDLDYAQFSRTSAKPKTILHEQIIKETGEDFWRDFVLGKVKEKRLPMPWTELSQDEVDGWVRRAYLSFYLRPSCIYRAMTNLKSGNELKRYVRSTLKMLVRFSHA